MKQIVALSLGLLLALAFIGCSDSTTPTNAPPAPTGLTATGELGKIVLHWNAGVAGSRAAQQYNVYRSANGGSAVKRTASPISATTYEDIITSPDGDGVLYTYSVKAVESRVESAASNTAASIHGTRISASQPTGFTADLAHSPYIVDGTVTVDNGNFTIPTGCKVFVMGGAKIDMPADPDGEFSVGRLEVNGLLRVLASNSNPATFTAHKAGGLADGEGFVMTFVNATSYNPADGSGTLLQNCIIEKLKGDFGGNTVIIDNCAPKFVNSYINFNTTTASSFRIDTGVVVDHCYLTNGCPSIMANVSGTGFAFTNNIVRGGSANYCLEFRYSTDTPIDTGAITGNDIAVQYELDLVSMNGDYTIPLGGNYWRGGAGAPPIPDIRRQSAPDCAVDFTTALSEAPVGVGPDWSD